MKLTRLLAAGVGAAAVIVAPLLATAPAGAATAANATIKVVHGIPATPVDVYANGSKLLSDFTFKTVSQPLSVPGGSYTIDLRKAGSPASSAPILSATEKVPAGANVTLVADLTAAGKPALVPFVNDTSAVGSGKGVLVVRHTAAAPAVDVYAGSTKVISSLTNGNQAKLTVPAAIIPAKVTLAGQTAAVIGPVSVPVTAGMATVVYTIGSASGHSLTAVTQQYALGGTPGSAQGRQRRHGGRLEYAGLALRRRRGGRTDARPVRRTAAREALGNVRLARAPVRRPRGPR
ncbi:MAG: DUF4397 domain-containing protein [Streptosporangiaceae bacterium]